MTIHFRKLLVLFVALSLALPLSVFAAPAGTVQAAEGDVAFTILHTNDFHGNLELSGSNPGAARVAAKVKEVRAAKGAENVLLLDAGDIMQGSLLSNLQQGFPTIEYYKAIGYDAFTLGNHEFDWGQDVLRDRIAQAADTTDGKHGIKALSANVTVKDGSGACTWTPADFVQPYEVFEVGPAGNTVKVGVIGVSSIETPYITIAAATEGLCFRDPLEAITRVYDEVNAASDVIVVLSHNGFIDGGYGYGFTVYGDQTLAKKLNDAGKPVNLIIGGHSHSDVAAPVVVGNTYVVQAHYAGRKVNQADFVYNKLTGAVSIAWTRNALTSSSPEDTEIKALVAGYASDPAYLAQINQPVGYTQVDLVRNYDGDSMMGSFIQDAVYGHLNSDAVAENDADFVFNNSGGIRIDWCDKLEGENWVWTSTAADCQAEGVWGHGPMLLTYGQTFQILPFGNATIVGDMTGAQVLELLNQSATLFKGAIQVSGIRYSFYRYSDSKPGPQPWAWGAYDVEVFDKASDSWVGLDLEKTYRVATNEFLAPAGQDGYTPFKYMTNISYWGDMLDAVNAYVAATYTETNPYKGPDGDGTLDGRIYRDGTNATGSIVPLTVLHHNDSHGRLLPSGTYPGYTNLATLIKQEREHNPDRTLLVSAGDNVQGDSMMYFFKEAGLGHTADGTALSDELSINPLIKAFNAMDYNAMTLGNHEYNFGKNAFSTLAQAEFPILQANVSDTGEYGIAAVPVEPYTEVTVGSEGIKVGILGIGNHRVVNYELPSNIPGLSFSNPIEKGQELAPTLAANNDVVIALTHIGFTTDPKSVEVDDNVDTVFAAQVPAVDAVIGSHSHTDPTKGQAPYKYLPAIVAGVDNVPVLVTQAGRYNSFLGEVVMGLRENGAGGYEVVSRAGRSITVTTATPEDVEIKAIVDPYKAIIDAYNNTEIGSTLTPIDTMNAYTEETNGANLQADAAVWKLESEGIEVDFHLSGAMTNKLIAETATPTTPVSLKISDMFNAMPYENSLLVLSMNGPQLKAVLERAYRNYYYYKYVPGRGGYSYYTTCMIDTDAGNEIVYKDTYPLLPNGHNVAALVINGTPVDFSDAETYYNVSTVNYLAAGSCNFNNAGVSLWPINQVVQDTQYYVRDSVIEYIQAQTEPINPQIEGRLVFNELGVKVFFPILGK